jgi:cell division protein FtsL
MGKEKDKENVEFVNPTEEKNELKKYSLKEILTGSVLAKKSVSKQLPFIIFLAFLGIVYIANRYHAEKVLRETAKLQQELEELRAESITTASELMFSSRQSQVVKMIKENDLSLKEATTPPKRVKMRD